MKKKKLNPVDVVLKWITFFNQQNANLLASLYTNKSVNDQIAEKPLKGKKKIQIMFEETFFTFPDIACIPVNLVADGNWVALEWSGWSTMQNPLGKNKATKKRSYMRGCGFFKIINGKIILQHGYWDKNSWYKQLGIKIEN
ncbi:MAG: ester cyclase [Bacteroidetes bacterium]|nr:ester cyclase [Bacteroidota bacterium]